MVNRLDSGSLPAMERDPLQAAVCAFEQATGLSLCLHSAEPRLLAAVAPARRRYHHHPACRAAKATRNRACVAFCGERVQREAATAAQMATAGRAILTRCHAGHGELVVAVRQAGAVVGVLFAGVVRLDSALRPDLVDGSALPPLAAAAGLPQLDAEAVPWMGELLVQLAWRLERLLVGSVAAAATPRRALLPAQAGTGEETRADRLRAWIAQHGATGGDLAGLANYLGISVERARHLAAAADLPWRATVRRARLDLAAELLTTTSEPIARIAKRIGYQDPASFSAAFRAFHGKTPRAWRNQHQADSAAASRR
jgi:AraC-like DNA-binding protein